MPLFKATLLLSAVLLEMACGQPLGYSASESNSAFTNNLLNNGNLGSTFLNLQNANGNFNNFSPLTPNGVTNGNCGCGNSISAGNISPLGFSGNINNFSPLANIVNEVPNVNSNCGCGSSIAASGNFLPTAGKLNANLSPLLANAGLSGSLNYVPTSPIITEVVPNLRFGEVTCSGDLPVGGTIKVCGCFPVYGMIAVDGSVPTSGTAVIDTGNNVVTQVF